MTKKILQRKIIITIFIALTITIGLIVFIFLNFRFRADQTLALASPIDLIAIEPDTHQSINLEWIDNSNNEDGYKIERTDDVVHDFQEIASLDSNSTTYSDSGANFIPDQRYYYRVQAFNEFGSSEYSRIATPIREEAYNLIQGIGSFEQSSIDDSTGIGWRKNYVLSESNIDFHLDDKGINNSKSQYIGLKGAMTSGFNQLFYSAAIVKENDQYSIQPGDILVLDVNKYFFSGSYEKGYTTIGYDIRDKDGNVIDTTRFSLDKLPESNPGQLVSQEYQLPASTYKVSITIMLHASQLTETETIGINLDEIVVNVKKVGETSLATVSVPAREKPAMLTQGLQFWDSKYPYENAKNYDVFRLERPEYVPMIKYYNPNIQLLYADKLGIDDSRTDANADPVNGIKLHTKMAYVLNNHPEWLIQYNNQKLERPSGDRIKYLLTDSNRDPNPEGSKQYLTKGTDGVTSMNFVSDDFYQRLYWTDPTNQNYQKELRENMIQNVKKFRFDGLWFDNTNPLNYDIYKYKDGVDFDLDNLGPDDPSPENLDNTNRQALVNNATPNKMQDFVHGVLPSLYQENISIALNNAMQHYNDWPAKVLLNPFWDPVNPGNVAHSGWQPSFKGKILTDNFDEVKNNPAEVQYKKNSFDTTPDMFFQEWGFFPHYVYDGEYRNRYTALDHWLKTIQDMDIVEEWNKNIPEGSKKTIAQLVISVDRPDLGDPFLNSVAENEKDNLDRYDNGSAYFALTSFLLGSNQYSYLGIKKNTLISADKTFTTQHDISQEMYEDINVLGEILGQPTETRKIVLNGTVYDKDDAALDSDDKKVLQTRKFTNGLVVVNGSPDQDKSYTLEEQMKDDLERIYPLGTQLNLKPHSGRIFFSETATKPTPTPTVTAEPTPIPTKSATSKLPTPTPELTQTIKPMSTPIVTNITPSPTSSQNNWSQNTNIDPPKTGPTGIILMAAGLAAVIAGIIFLYRNYKKRNGSRR